MAKNGFVISIFILLISCNQPLTIKPDIIFGGPSVSGKDVANLVGIASLVASTGGVSGGSIANVNDGNASTYLEYSNASGGPGVAAMQQILITLDIPYYLTTVEVIGKIQVSGGGAGTLIIETSLDGSSYSTVYTNSSVPYTQFDIPVTINANVKYVRVKLQANGAGPPSSASCWIYEIYANISLIDSGLRANTSGGVIDLAIDYTNTSALKINSGGGVRGIMLVPTTSIFASPIRINTSSGIKSLVKVT